MASGCILVTSTCIFAWAGCLAKLTESDKTRHMKAKEGEHLEMAANHVKVLETENKEVKEELVTLKDEMAILRKESSKRHEMLETSLKDALTSLGTLKARLDSMAQENAKEVEPRPPVKQKPKPEVPKQKPKPKPLPPTKSPEELRLEAQVADWQAYGQSVAKKKTYRYKDGKLRVLVKRGIKLDPKDDNGKQAFCFFFFFFFFA